MLLGIILLTKYTAVSLANKRNWDWTFSGKLLMYSKNNIGPSTDPWGPPEVTFNSSECWPSKFDSLSPPNAHLNLNLNSLLVKRQIDNPSPGAVTGGN